MNKRIDYMKLSQHATNEIWSMVLRREYKTPAQKKRAIERQVRHALEVALGLPSTCGGWDEDDVGDWMPIFGNSEPTIAKRNPHDNQEPARHD